MARRSLFALSVAAMILCSAAADAQTAPSRRVAREQEDLANPAAFPESDASVAGLPQNTTRTVAGQVGVRQSRADLVDVAKPLLRVASRIQNRIASRVPTRIDRFGQTVQSSAAAYAAAEQEQRKGDAR